MEITRVKSPEDDSDYPPWVEKLSIDCSRGDCGQCRWPLCSCPHHDDD